MTPPTTTALEGTPGRDYRAAQRQTPAAQRQTPAAQRQTPSGLRLRLDAVAKRSLDFVAAIALLVLLLPLFLLIAALIKLDSRGPLFYRCRRVGMADRDLYVLKFRKMRDGARGPALTVGGDARFTRIGKLLAATKLDELPQLINVLRGDMSLVGPRPEDERFVTLMREEYRPILSVKPGMTGLTQLAFANESDILDQDDTVGHYVERLLPQKVRIDTLYAQNRTVAMDIRILTWTAIAVGLRREVAVNRNSGCIGLRRRAGYRAALPARFMLTDRRRA